MPKKIYEIGSFNAGIVANPNDELDIPDNAATYSLNIEPLTKGELKGIPKATFLKPSGFSQHYLLVEYNRPRSQSFLESRSQVPIQNIPDNQSE